MLDKGEITSAELVSDLLQRVADADRDGPGLRAVIGIDETVIERAAELDKERQAGHLRGPLHGLPVLVKDNLDTAGLPTTAGSLALAAPESQPERDSPVVAALRASGAIILGKANLSEWANFRARKSVSGWSAVGGQCRNPHSLDRSPGGSSSGSGAAVAAGMAPLAVGTETDGSILCPAAVCGVVGIKPTVGLTSRRGVVPISKSQDTVGPMARSVEDAALMLLTMARTCRDEGGIGSGGPPGEPGDWVPVAASGEGSADDREQLSAWLAGATLRGARVGVLRGRYSGHSPQVEVLVKEALEAIKLAGAEVVDPVLLPTAEELAESGDEMTVLVHEFKSGLEAYLAARPGPPDACPRTMAELIEFDNAHADRELAVFGHEILVMAAESEGVEGAAYQEARRRNLERVRERGLEAVFRDERLDVLVSPTMAPAWFIDHVNFDAVGGSSYGPAAVAGYPGINVPIGKVRGLPAGLSLYGLAWSDWDLVRLAYAVERELALGSSLAPRWQDSVPMG